MLSVSLNKAFPFLFSVLRNKLSRIFSACIQARHCLTDCGHTYSYVSQHSLLTTGIMKTLCSPKNVCVYISKHVQFIYTYCLHSFHKLQQSIFHSLFLLFLKMFSVYKSEFFIWFKICINFVYILFPHCICPTPI